MLSSHSVTHLHVSIVSSSCCQVNRYLCAFSILHIDSFDVELKKVSISKIQGFKSTVFHKLPMFFSVCKVKRCISMSIYLYQKSIKSVDFYTNVFIFWINHIAFTNFNLIFQKWGGCRFLHRIQTFENLEKNVTMIFKKVNPLTKKISERCLNKK